MLFSKSGLWDVSDYGSTPKFTAGEKGKVNIDKKDRDILRRLAEKVAVLAKRSIESEKRDLWFKHNSLKTNMPVIFCDPENGWNEIITENEILCESELAKKWELVLKKEIFWAEEICDDKVIEPHFEIGYTYSDSGWGLEPKINRKDLRGSITWDAPVKHYKDLEKIKLPELNIDFETTNQTRSLAEEIFKGILEVKVRGVWWWSLGLTNDLAILRGLEQIMYDMIDNTDLIHSLMNKIGQGTINKLDYLEKNNLLSLNTFSYVGSGGFGYTRELPSGNPIKNNVKLTELWGFSESQETGQISPMMFEEFIFRYQLPILEKFGLNCYGCCEPLDKRWEVIKKIPNLRRVSVSPWADNRKMADLLEDKYIYSLKPNPSQLALPNIDSRNILKNIKNYLEITKNCIPEIIMKDNHTLGNNPNNVKDWVKLLREEINNIKR
jgi:hypothetical protein